MLRNERSGNSRTGISVLSSLRIRFHCLRIGRNASKACLNVPRAELDGGLQNSSVIRRRVAVMIGAKRCASTTPKKL